jgi:hypothetical protein
MHFANAGIQAVGSIGIVVRGSCFCLSCVRCLPSPVPRSTAATTIMAMGSVKMTPLTSTGVKTTLAFAYASGGHDEIAAGPPFRIAREMRQLQASGLRPAAFGLALFVLAPVHTEWVDPDVPAKAPRPRFPLFLRQHDRMG